MFTFNQNSHNIHYVHFSRNGEIMKTTATELKNQIGTFIQKAHQEPIIVEKFGKPSVVLISYEDFERFSGLEDFYWASLAHKAINQGYLTPEESEKRLKEMAARAGVNIEN